jgi:iduronate 2-sulfatase
VTLSQHFMQAGYFTARVGKIYHYGNPGDIGTPGLDDPASWQLAINPAGRDRLLDEPSIIQYTGKKMTFGASLSWLAAEGSDSDHTDGKVADETIRLLKEKKDQPFFIACGFYKPHTPYVAPKRYFDLYPPAEQIPLAEVRPGENAQRPPQALWNSNDKQLDDTKRRLLRRAYWACISFADAQIKRVLDTVDELGLREKTIIVFWSDHGYHLGEHSTWQKQMCFERVARVPLIISAPQLSAGKTCPATVELIDLYPTLSDLAGLQTPANLQGKSLRPLLTQPDAEWDRPAYTQTQRGKDKAGNWIFGRSVRHKQWRYTEWGPDGATGKELYDLVADPGEFKNLANDPATAEAQAEMHKVLRAMN